MDTRPQEWDARYQAGDLPWDTGRHGRNLERIIHDEAIAPCRAIELGCGTGTNALWLAAQGFNVTAVDISATALADARKKVRHTESKTRFVKVDIRQIAAHVEALFEIRSLRATHFDSDQPAPAPAWACLMRRR